MEAGGCDTQALPVSAKRYPPELTDHLESQGVILSHAGMLGSIRPHSLFPYVGLATGLVGPGMENYVSYFTQLNCLPPLGFPK